MSDPDHAVEGDELKTEELFVAVVFLTAAFTGLVALMAWLLVELYRIL